MIWTTDSDTALAIFGRITEKASPRVFPLGKVKMAK